MIIENIVGWSIYPVAWLISIITNLINGGPNVIDIPGSVPFYLLLAFFNFFGLSVLGGFIVVFIVFILIWVNFIVAKKPLPKAGDEANPWARVEGVISCAGCNTANRHTRSTIRVIT